jgi:DNA-binding SARP family transcriptional activator
MTRLSITTLGTLQASLDDMPLREFESDKARALLVYLAVEASRPHRREALAGLLWPDISETAARANLRRVLSNVRQVIGDRNSDAPFLLVSHQSIQFDVERDFWLDVAEFEQAVRGEPGRSPAIHEMNSILGLPLQEISTIKAAFS